MYISVRVDYAARALLVLGQRDAEFLPCAEIADSQGISASHVRSSLLELRRSNLVVSGRGRGSHVGYRLARPLSTITMAELFYAMKEPVAETSDRTPGLVPYNDATIHLTEAWNAVRESLQSTLERITLQDIATGMFSLPTRC